jgi:hypothetical protein
MNRNLTLIAIDPESRKETRFTIRIRDGVEPDIYPEFGATMEADTEVPVDTWGSRTLLLRVESADA